MKANKKVPTAPGVFDLAANKPNHFGRRIVRFTQYEPSGHGRDKTGEFKAEPGFEPALRGYTNIFQHQIELCQYLPIRLHIWAMTRGKTQVHDLPTQFGFSKSASKIAYQPLF